MAAIQGAAPTGAAPPLYGALLRKCGGDVGRVLAALRRAAEDREHPRDASYAPERYGERGSIELAALLALLAPFAVLLTVAAVLVGVAR